MDIAFKVALVAAVAVLTWWALQPRYAFVVSIAGGVPRVSRGKVTAGFLQEVERACAEAGVTDGWFGGVRRGRQTALTFSRSIPPHTQQRLRNLWGLHG
jgi:hypothetical protein